MFKAFLMAALLLVSTASNAQNFGTYQIPKADITEVYDGDTMYITEKSCPPVFCTHIGVRLNGIDTPEMHGACQLEKDKALKAKQYLANAIKQGSVVELRNTTREKYGRLLGDLYIDGQPIGDQMVANGLAVSYHGEKKVTDWCKTN